MLPAINTPGAFVAGKSPPGRTFRLHAEQPRIFGMVDGLAVVRQAVYLILNVERYHYLIYGWNYGIELSDLFGRPAGFVQSELKRRIAEALMQDDRIQDVADFVFSRRKGRVSCRFTVRTALGDIPAEKEVAI